MTKEMIIRSVAFFLLAGLCEIGGGYLVWIALKKNEPIWVAIFGAMLLATYGAVATLQPASFGRTYAAYGGIFIVMSILWGWFVEKIRPDMHDIIGAAIVMIGVAVIFFAPRRTI